VPKDNIATADILSNKEQMVFVYGTLRKRLNSGSCWNYQRYLAPLEPIAVIEVTDYHLVYWGEGRNNPIPKRARTEYEPAYGIPVMIPKHGGKVTGEVYRVDARRLRQIDYLEGVNEAGVGSVYRRVELSVTIDGKNMPVLAYIGNKEEGD